MRKLLPVALFLMVAAFGVYAGGGQAASGKPVELRMYLIGTEPVYHHEFNEALNKLLRRDFNATIKITYIDFINWQSEYELVLSSGEQVDLIFTAYWANYERYARLGYYYPLDELLGTSGQAVQRLHKPEVWNMTRVDGDIFAVPAAQERFLAHGFMYRRDLDSRPGRRDITDIESMEAFLDSVRGTSNIRPFNVNRIDAPTVLTMALRSYGYSYNPAYGDYLLAAPPGDSAPVASVAFAKGIEEALQRFRRWQLAGYLPPDFLERSESANWAFVKGESAVSGSISIADAYDDMRGIRAQHPDWDVGFWLQPPSDDVYHRLHPLQDAMAIGRRSANPALALQVLEKIMTSREYYDLFFYGVEGIHYRFSEEVTGGGARMIFSPDVERWNMSNWGFRNTAMDREQKLDWPEWDRIIATVSSDARYPDLVAPGVNLQPLAAQHQRIAAIAAASIPALAFGLLPDPIANLNKLRRELLDAGYEEFIQALIAQTGR